VDYQVVLLTSALIYILSFSSTINGVLFGRSCYRQSFAAHASGKTLFIVLAFVSLLFTRNYQYLLLVMLLGALLQLLLVLYYIGKEGIIIPGFRLKGEELKNILKVSLPMGIGIFFVIVYDKIDILLIKIMLNPESIAVYSAAYSIYKLPQILISIILVPLFTELSYQYKKQISVNIDVIKTAGFYLLIYSMVVVLLLFLTAGSIIPLIFGEKYNSSIKLAQILALALPGLFLNNLTGVVLNSIQKEKYPLYSAIIGVIINIGANIILIPAIGIYGAVCATILVETLVFLLQANMLKNIFIIKTR
jgi:O-antigen/teichoic acid export membrane protein